MAGWSVGVTVFSLLGRVANCNIIYFMVVVTHFLRSDLTLHCKSYITWLVCWESYLLVLIDPWVKNT